MEADVLTARPTEPWAERRWYPEQMTGYRQVNMGERCGYNTVAGRGHGSCGWVR